MAVTVADLCLFTRFQTEEIVSHVPNRLILSLYHSCVTYQKELSNIEGHSLFVFSCINRVTLTSSALAKDIFQSTMENSPKTLVLHYDIVMIETMRERREFLIVTWVL